MRHYACLLALMGAALLGGCADKKADPTPPPAPVGSLHIDVENVVGPDPLVLDTRTYTSPAGEPFTVSTFRYYLSNFKLTRADGSQYAVPESYFLVRELRPTDPWTDTGKHIVLDSIPAGDYTGVSFLIGVDEARNTAGAQTGALAQSNHMFWDWRQGYIFLQMEGHSPASGDPVAHLLSYHIGDFANPNNLREVAPPLPGGATIRLAAGGRSALKMRADLLRLFTGGTPDTDFPVEFGPYWSASGGRDASTIATNYGGSPERGVVGTNSMFAVTEVQN
ncbi:hypothetical protein Q5H93_12095 [Hymenobacter sp. ASUV-10]|uniref:Copper-binding protein MbnP-like domain-containing protein n=1 Tax=Hymenobacter aranciens TaxID=3063996 RepID=A0ABT9BB28_9BACT|nr:MbnP family protein [Hymenobacter sp. ASUV-10]MDO7875475.1 hypothetical protein [Hymenobacter sp. ASUV-10]